jgi:hypothetical protein
MVNCGPRRRRYCVICLLGIASAIALFQQVLFFSRHDRRMSDDKLVSSVFDDDISHYDDHTDEESDELSKRLALSGTSPNCTDCRRFYVVDNATLSAESVLSWHDANGKEVTCFRPGLDLNGNYRTRTLFQLHSELHGYGRCKCRQGWYGRGCGVPEIIWKSRRWLPFPVEGLTVRKRPRRVVQALPFNMEFDLLDIRLAEIGDTVDVFLVVESNYTAHGDKKPYRLRDHLAASGCNWRQHGGTSSNGAESSSSTAASQSQYVCKLFLRVTSLFPCWRLVVCATRCDQLEACYLCVECAARKLCL